MRTIPVITRNSTPRASESCLNTQASKDIPQAKIRNPFFL